MKIGASFSGLAFLALSLLCGAASGADEPAVDRALAVVTANSVRDVIATLSSDQFEGREPGSHGESLTIDYIANQFQQAGLEPGNPDGSYLQNVPLTGHIAHSEAVLAGTKITAPEDYVAWSYRRDSEILLQESELVFVGYGVVAPEYGWDDYKGVDLKGKTLIMLINDPPIPDPKDPGKLDETMFKGKTMTYYGRWDYKYEIAARLGAAAALIIHETEPAGYPYRVVVNSFGRENFDIHGDLPNPHFPTVPGWIAEERARTVLKSAGFDLDMLKQDALSRDFRPIPLGKTASFKINKSWRDVASHNVVGLIPGIDPKLRSELLVISAHWDHLGWDPTIKGSKHEQIFHGARDNASGIAALLSLAKAFQIMPPKRSILFLATTGEEKGLLGAQYYAAHPLYPLRRTVADINIDGINFIGRTRDIEVVGSGNTTLEDRLAGLAANHGRVARPDSHGEKGFFYRADQLEFARVGVPVLYLKIGDEALADPDAYRAKVASYIANSYHRPSDELTDDWDFSAAIEDISLIFRIAAEVASGDVTPQWKPGSEFKAARDKMMATGRP